MPEDLCCMTCYYCTVLPILTFLHGTFFLIPSTIITMICVCGLALFHYPQTIISSFWTIAVNKNLGKNITTVYLILLPIPLILYPFAVFFGSIIFGIGYSYWISGCSIMKTLSGKSLNNDESCCGCIYNCFLAPVIEPVKLSKDLHKFFNSTFDEFKKTREAPLIGDEPWDIRIFEGILCIFIGLIGTVVDSFLITGSIIILVIPVMIKSYYIVNKIYFMFACEYCLIFISTIICITIVDALMWAAILGIAFLLCIGSLFTGFYITNVAYTDGVAEGFKAMWTIVCDLWKKTKEFLINDYKF